MTAIETLTRRAESMGEALTALRGMKSPLEGEVQEELQWLQRAMVRCSMNSESWQAEREEESYWRTMRVICNLEIEAIEDREDHEDDYRRIASDLDDKSLIEFELESIRLNTYAVE